MFSESLMAHCMKGLTLRNEGAFEVVMHECSESGTEHAASLCGHLIADSLKRSIQSHQYDRVIGLRDAGTGEMRTKAAIFMKRASEDVYEVTHIALTGPIDTRCPDHILLCLAAEAAAYCGCKAIMWHESNENYNRAHLRRLVCLLGFYWLDSEGFPTTNMDNFPKKKRDPVAILKCYKNCRPLFPHAGVFFASCVPHGRDTIANIVTNAAGGEYVKTEDREWDIYFKYGDKGQITMKKTETGYEVHQRQCDAVHYEKGVWLAREAAAYESGVGSEPVLTFL